VAAAAQAGLTLLPDLYSVPGWISSKPANPPIYTPAQRQAWTNLRRFASCVGECAGTATAATWFSFADRDSPGPDFWIDRAGPFRLNGRPKPAWFAFARVAGGTP
jgi:hypothetical protein